MAKEIQTNLKFILTFNVLTVVLNQHMLRVIPGLGNLWRTPMAWPLAYLWRIHGVPMAYLLTPLS